jgi:ferrous iron transport protein B
VIFGLTYAVGTPLQGLLETYVVGGSAQLAARALSAGPAWLSSLVVDGVIGGVGSMLSFIPILVIFFVFLGVLEDVGYMARAGYVMDRFMHLMGLHGKSFMPLFLGFGCNVPAVMGTRVIESRRGRLLATMIVPFVPCTARMMVWLSSRRFSSVPRLLWWPGPSWG